MPEVHVPSVSIVITCFNYERYIALSVGSVLAQTVRPTEIIVVNDGSTDGSAEVLRRFGEKVKVIDQTNSGQIAATNRGYAASSGDIVMFLDADDMLEAGAIEAVLEVWTQQCAKVQFELEVINGTGEPLGRRFCNYVEPYGPQQIREEFASFGTYVWPVLTGNAYARWFLERVMPLTVKVAPDGVLNTVAPLYGDVHVVPRPLGRYRLHDANQNYHGTSSRSLGPRFAKQVSIRVGELQILAVHAEACGSKLPEGRLIDHDLPSVNYRLMLQKLGEPYEGSKSDSTARLWRAGMNVLLRRPLPKRLKLVHATWMTVLLLSPQWLASKLILLRFERAAIVQPVRRRIASILGRSFEADTVSASPETRRKGKP